MRTLSNSEGPDEMPHYCGISFGSTLLAKTKTTLRKRNTNLFGNYNIWLHDIHNAPPQVRCIKETATMNFFRFFLFSF